MKRLLLMVLVTIITCTNLYAQTPTSSQSEVIKTLIANINAKTLQRNFNTEQIINQFSNGKQKDLVKSIPVSTILHDKTVDGLIQSQNADGSWADIDYADQNRSNWKASNHTSRILSLCRVYKTSDSKFYNSPELSAVIHKAMNYWFEAKLVCPNWWYNTIGVPSNLGPAMLLIKDEMSDQEKATALKVTMDQSTFSLTGQNKVWLANNILKKALLVDDYALAQRARDTIFSEIYMSTAEGLQPDYSFHQHGPMMQFGNYGLSYLATISELAQVFSGTPMALNEQKLGYLTGYMIEGMRWTVFRGNMDVSACGRQVVPNAQPGKGRAVAIAATNMIDVDRKNADTYKKYLYENSINPKTDNSLTGNRYFWRSDYMIQRAPKWFASVRMHSSRTLGFEMTNRENLQGLYVSDGGTIVMVDGDEYNNIFPMWDWKKLPGTTVAQIAEAIPYTTYTAGKPTHNPVDFVGGVSSGDLGASAMVLNRKGVKAQKAYFFLDNVLVCLGTGISSDTNLDITTGIEQSVLKGDVALGLNGKTKQLDPKSTINESKVNWIHHNKIGYCMLQTTDLVISNSAQTGTWRSIANYHDTDPQTMDLFKVYVNHGQKPQNGSYAYVILPNQTKAQTAAFSKKPGVSILVNNNDCQAVTNSTKSVCQAVFYSPATVTIANGKQISALNGGIMVISKNDKGSTTVAVSDPTQKLDAFSFTVNGKLSGDNITYNVDNNQSLVKIALPTKEGLRGSSVQTTINGLL